LLQVFDLLRIYCCIGCICCTQQMVSKSTTNRNSGVWALCHGRKRSSSGLGSGSLSF